MMTEKITDKKIFLFILFIFSFILFSANNHNVSIYILDEAKNAACAKEMMETRQWNYPTFNYELRVDKPPLHYLFMSVSYWLFGINPWAARFFSAIFGALTILLVFRFTSRFVNKNAALWASAILLASIHFQLQHHMAVPDPYLIFFVTWGIMLFYSVLKYNRVSDKILMYVAFSFGFLAKGPIAILLPGLIFVIYLAVIDELKLKTILRFKPLMGLVITLFVTLPWFLSVHFATDGEWTKGFFFDHNLNRFANKMEGHGGIFLLTYLYVFIGLLPFSLYFFQSFKHYRKNSENKFLLFALISIIVIVVFFSFSSTKLPNYTVIAYPYLAIFVANYLSSKDVNKKSELRNITVLLILIIIAFPSAYIAMGYDEILKPLRYLLLWVLIFPTGIALALYFIKSDKFSIGRKTLVATSILTGLIFFYMIYPVIDKENPVELSKAILHDREVSYLHRFNPAYSFALQKQIPKIEEKDIPWFFTENPDGVIISTEKNIEKIEFPEGYGIIFKHKDVFEIPTTVLIGSVGNKVP
jgi:4-amino-4-deoxy-L-arabinose transferase-like glycosyltransferase